MNDTVPPEHMNLYGSFVNSGFCAGIFLSNFFGLMVPLDDGENPDVIEQMKEDGYWRLVYGFPIVL